MPSKNGVFYELKESPYSFMYGDCTFFFSSRKHLSSFMDKICVRTQWLDDSMEKRFRVPTVLHGGDQGVLRQIGKR